MYISDWVNGWDKTGKGRIWKVTSQETDPRVAEVKALLAEGMAKRPVDELGKLLGHADQRVRLEAQYELAARAGAEIRAAGEIFMRDGDKAKFPERPAGTKLSEVAETSNNRLARIHAIWAGSQISRYAPTAANVYKQLNDQDEEIRAQGYKVIGEESREELQLLQTLDGNPRIPFESALEDSSPRVKFYAALAVGKLGDRRFLPKLLDLLRENADRDAYLRHAAVMGLVGINDVESLTKAASDPSRSVRLGALLALRRLGKPEVAKFLADSDPKIATEAALAIYEAPIPDALPSLADLAGKKGLTEALQRRAINAAGRVGRAEDASGIAAVAGRSEASKNLRVESLSILATWANPPGRDRINGLWRPIDVRPSKVAADALRPNVKALLNDSADEVRRGVIAAVGELGIKEAGPDLVALVVQGKGSGLARADAIKALEKLDEPKLADAVEAAVVAVEGRVRSAGLRVLARLSPERAISAITKVLDSGEIPEQQQALEVLGSSDRPEADAILATWLDRLIRKQAPASLELEILEAASKRKSARVTDLLDRFEKARPKDGPLADHHAELEGGDADRGRKIYRDNAAVYCVRCHKVRGEGGEVGPDLTGIGTKQPRTYLLESIVVPNQAIAQGFESVVLAKTDGTVVTGVLKSEDDKTVKVMTAEAKLIEVPKADIEERKRGPSAMPDDLSKKLSRSERRDLVEFLSNLK